MNILSDFLSSEVWNDVSSRVIATFSFSGIATVVNAIPAGSNETVNMLVVSDLIPLFTLISYGVSILVGCTVLARFFIWLKDRKKR